MSIRVTARFELERRHQLEALFATERLTKLWRSLVKDQMRALEIGDLHDYYDFNYSIEARSELIVERILAGQYKAENPLVYRVEKKLGVCRHMMIPTPSDALVFQILTEALYPDVIKHQPSKRAFYARDRHTLQLPHEHQEAHSYPWFILWPKFQKEIWNFTKEFAFLVTTDLTNYFDNIGLRELRHVISSIAKPSEVVLDVLFSLIEDLSWRPDYLPTSMKGLPTINIEAPRLLSHALLFEVDRLLKFRTENNFVRWMDDINFGVDDRRSANLLLGEINDVLKSRGLALNLAKTEVMTASEAEEHFMFNENLRLTEVDDEAKELQSKSERTALANKLAREIRSHLKKCKARNKDKITKRYLTLLGRLAIPCALDDAKLIYAKQPGLRSSVVNYFSRLPFSKKVADSFYALFDEVESYDDSSRFGLVSAVTRWDIPRNKRGREFIDKVAAKLNDVQTQFDWLCLLWFQSKYGQPHEVLTTAQARKKHHANEPFFARQRMAALTRGLGINPGTVIDSWSSESTMGSADSASVATNLLHFVKQPFPTKQDRAYFYLFPQNQQKPYPLSKFLLLCAIAYGERQSGKTIPRPEVQEHITDPWFRHWLSLINPSWFSQ